MAKEKGKEENQQNLISNIIFNMLPNLLTGWMQKKAHYETGNTKHMLK